MEKPDSIATCILLVEDNTGFLDDVSFHLEMHNYKVIKVTNGRAALDYLASTHELPDIVVSDISMPDMDGYELLKILQQDTRYSNLPFIFLTALDSRNDIRLGKQLGADDYLIKPFHVDDLIIAIENRLRRVAQWRADMDRQVDLVREQLLSLIHNRQDSSLDLLTFYSDGCLNLEDLEAMPDEFSQQSLQAIHDTMRHANRLIQQITLLIKLDRGQIKTYLIDHPQVCNLHLIVEAACDSITKEFAEGEISFQLKLPSSPIHVVGLHDLLSLVIEEVIRNAVIFSPPGNSVFISIDAKVNHAAIQVVDHGIGIANEHIPFIWDRFRQFCRTLRSQQGAGLGLAVVYECTRILRGKVSMKSEIDLGTTMTLYFPLSDS